MGRRKPEDGQKFVLVDVVYEDGAQLSNRKVPKSRLSGFDDVTDIRQAIEAQDQEIAEKSRQPRGPIVSVTRVKRR